jgi:hypothetical protein
MSPHRRQALRKRLAIVEKKAVALAEEVASIIAALPAPTREEFNIALATFFTVEQELLGVSLRIFFHLRAVSEAAERHSTAVPFTKRARADYDPEMTELMALFLEEGEEENKDD